MRSSEEVSALRPRRRSWETSPAWPTRSPLCSMRVPLMCGRPHFRRGRQVGLTISYRALLKEMAQ